jgi:hypothetical protein
MATECGTIDQQIKSCPNRIDDSAKHYGLNETTARETKTGLPNDYYESTQNELIKHESQALKIKTKSIENTLIPLVNQIANLVNLRDHLKLSNLNSSSIYSERTNGALLRVGESVNLAVERFVLVGESIAYENSNIRLDMLEACQNARNAGKSIRQYMLLPNGFMSKQGEIKHCDNLALIQSANTLLNSVTKVLLLADVVLINQILNSKNRVFLTLIKLESVFDLSNFLSLFTQYGDDLIELAHLSGERQKDLKDEKKRSQLSSARWILEKSTVMILSATKTYLKHLECECAKENIDLVYSFIQQTLETLHYVVLDSGSLFDYATESPEGFVSSITQISFINAMRQFEDTLDLVKNDLITAESNDHVLANTLNCLIDSTQDFTDSLYINNEQRERIIRMNSEISEKTQVLIRNNDGNALGTEYASDKNNNNSSNKRSKSPSNRAFISCKIILDDCEILKKILQTYAMQLANNLFRENQDATLLNCIRTYCASNHYDLLVETLDKFKDYADHVLEICKLLRHVSLLDIFEVTCEHHYNIFEKYTKLIQSAASSAALFPSCKAASDNLNLYCEYWENQINDLSVLVKEMHDFFNGIKSKKSIYYSLPRPGKHGTNARQATSSLNKPSKLDQDEQAKIAKLGLEMKLIQNEIETEADKWNEPQNEIVKIAKAMSDMACEIHLFTRGEGSLKTTQDLFNKADEFLQNGVAFYAVIKEFLNQIPSSYIKNELNALLDQLPVHFKQLKNKLKQVTFGKTATFNKVDCVIQDTRDFMNLVAKIVTNSFLCSMKVSILNAKNVLICFALTQLFIYLVQR